MIETLDAPLQDTLSREAEVASSAALSSESGHAGAGETAAASLRIGREAIEILQCPGCSGALSVAAEAMQCDACERNYPVADGVPVLVVPEKSLFDIETFTNAEPTFFRPVGKVRELISGCLPDVTLNVSSDKVYARMLQQMLERSEHPVVLVIGGGVIGGGMDCLVDDPRITLIETDAAIAPRTSLVCDGHDLPFADQSVDAVIVQAVLEHVVDPHRCVQEIHRVLKPGGLVYSDTPFMQQVHGRQFDFTRFTRLGHRRLFRMFDEIESGISCGPGTALAWSLRYFLLSFFASDRMRAAVSLASRLMFFPLKYCDRYLVNKASASDAASAFYFYGSRSETPLSDRELVASYHGGF
ncbi:methyltransferase domain-containing protein [Rosistilla carotiformis]|nr:methyltransferase domain-containing protein [Rosistilla carotiformis]